VTTHPTSLVRPLRRVPVQGRSVARVQRMLDACADLVDEVGYEGLTTTLLAERAEVAIGSVYQFFPDKRAVVQALTLRNLEAYLGRLANRFAEVSFPHWWDGVDAAIDEYIAMHREVPGFRTLHFGDVVDVHLLDETRDNTAVITDLLLQLLAGQFGMAETPGTRFALGIAVEVADALIKLAFRRSPEGDRATLHEAKVLVREYLNSHVDATATRVPALATVGAPVLHVPAAGGTTPAPMTELSAAAPMAEVAASPAVADLGPGDGVREPGRLQPSGVA
jgi:AcrR family transcriptional regulator